VIRYDNRDTGSLTVISSSPLAKNNSDLPSLSPAYLKHLAQLPEVNWN
jgi:hypothetical protein